jgi:hypothetical protein
MWAMEAAPGPVGADFEEGPVQTRWVACGGRDPRLAPDPEQMMSQANRLRDQHWCYLLLFYQVFPDLLHMTPL